MVEEEHLDSKLLRKVAVRVSLERHPLRAHVELLVFYLRLEDLSLIHIYTPAVLAESP